MSDPFDLVWHAFSNAETTADGRHDSFDWRSRQVPFAACIVRIPPDMLQPELHGLRTELRRLPGLRLHPDHFLHIMLQELGFVTEIPTGPDQISPIRLEEFAQAAVATAEALEPATITIGGVNSFEDAVFLEVRPTKLLRTLHERLFELAALPRVSDYPYLPHCTVGHYDGTVAVAEALTMLEPWRLTICGEAPISEIEIVTIDTSVPYPELSNYAVIPFQS